MKKQKYVVVRKSCVEDFEQAINELHDDGYALTHFQVVYDADSLRGYFGVMELGAPKRFNLEPKVASS